MPLEFPTSETCRGLIILTTVVCMWWMFSVFKANLEDKLQLSQMTQPCFMDQEHQFHRLNMQGVRMDHLNIGGTLKKIFLDNSCCPLKRNYFE